jgi:glycosyltransferase involved in cell wall biosynthesis
VVNFIGFGMDSKRGGSYDTFPYQRFIFEHPFWDMHITASEFERQQYEYVYERLGMSIDELITLPHAFDEDSYCELSTSERKLLRKKHGLSNEQWILIYPVQVYRRKNLELALEILARMQAARETVLVVTGRVLDDEYYRQLIDLSQSLGIGTKVHFLHGVPAPELREHLGLADAAVFPSHQETFGHGIVEALGSGTPVVGPAYIHPSREILEGSYGGWAAVKDADAFCQQLLQVLQCNLERESIAREARRVYGNRTVAQQWLEKVSRLHRKKASRKAFLKQFDWRTLYNDNLDLEQT